MGRSQDRPLLAAQQEVSLGEGTGRRTVEVTYDVLHDESEIAHVTRNYIMFRNHGRFGRPAGSRNARSSGSFFSACDAPSPLPLPTSLSSDSSLLQYAPGFYTGYGVKTLPAAREAIEQKQWKDADALIARTAAAVEREAALLKSATQTLIGK